MSKWGKTPCGQAPIAPMADYSRLWPMDKKIRETIGACLWPSPEKKRVKKSANTHTQKGGLFWECVRHL